MKTKILTALCFFLSFSALTQKEKCIKGFDIEKRVNNGETIVSFEEKNNSIQFFKAPLNDKGQVVNFIESTFKSRQILDSLERTIFSPAEILFFKDFRCIANVIVSSKGQIVKVSFFFNIYDNSEKEFFSKVNTEKLLQFAQKIKKNITFEFFYGSEIGEHGYFNQGFLVFKSFPDS